MGDKVVKNMYEKSIIDGVNSEKAPLFLLKKKLAFKDDIVKSNANSNSSKWRNGIYDIEI